MILNFYSVCSNPNQLHQFDDFYHLFESLETDWYLDLDNYDKIKKAFIWDPTLAYFYAKHYVKGRWLEAEPYIMKAPDYAFHYADNIIKGRWKEGEQSIVTGGDSWFMVEYATKIAKVRIPEFEIALMDLSRSCWEKYCMHFCIDPLTRRTL